MDGGVGLFGCTRTVLSLEDSRECASLGFAFSGFCGLCKGGFCLVVNDFVV